VLLLSISVLSHEQTMQKLYLNAFEVVVKGGLNHP